MSAALIIAGIIVHVVFLISIFDIYFTSPLLHGMAPVSNDIGDPPAKRLVLFVADGLRASTLYGDSMIYLAPYLRSMLDNGSWGISNTRVPTESRPGHVAIIAGIYEDPSAITKGWKHNPVEFDTVFNRSSYTWSWGSPDIVPMFAKSNGPHVSATSYSSEEEDFSGKLSTTILDTWVFNHVEQFFKDAIRNKTLYHQAHHERVIYFLHLLGLDTAGHVHKPHSKEYLENIRVVDEGIRKTVSIIRQFYNDDSTAFVFTADHGMTDWGSHGAGSASETETPLIVWGAGVAPHNNNTTQINQADIAPLIATLIGIPIPVNSIGVLPVQFLALHHTKIAKALFANARQIYAQYNEKRLRIEQNTLWLFYKPFPYLTTLYEEQLFHQIDEAFINKNFNQSMTLCRYLIEKSLDGLNYYQNYYQNMLLTCIASSFIGWIILLLISINNNQQSSDVYRSRQIIDFHVKELAAVPVHFIFILLVLFTFVILYIQSVPSIYYIYCTMPIFIWWTILRHFTTGFIKHVNKPIKSPLSVVSRTVLYIVGIETLVMSFFNRKFLVFPLVLMSLWPYYFQPISLKIKICWTGTCVILSAFPLLPVIGTTFNISLIGIATIIWILIGIGCLTAFIRAQLFHFNHIHSYVIILQILLIVITLFHLYKADVDFKLKIGLTSTTQIISWILLSFSVMLPVCGSSFIVARLLNIMLSLVVPFLLLSVSYEPLFLSTLFIHLLLWLMIEYKHFNLATSLEEFFIHLIFGNFNNKDSKQKRWLNDNIDMVNSEDYRRAYFILLYTVLAFFGTGNIASINSFDPMWTRHFLTVFSPFTMSALILLKIFIPYLLLCSTLRALAITVLRISIHRFFLIVLIFCDLMALQFLFLVRNDGSWLDIGLSISHFVIVQTMILILLLFYAITIPFTDCSIFNTIRPPFIHSQYKRQ